MSVMSSLVYVRAADPILWLESVFLPRFTSALVHQRSSGTHGGCGSSARPVRSDRDLSFPISRQVFLAQLLHSKRKRTTNTQRQIATTYNHGVRCHSSRNRTRIPSNGTSSQAQSPSIKAKIIRQTFPNKICISVHILCTGSSLRVGNLLL